MFQDYKNNLGSAVVVDLLQVFVFVSISNLNS